MINTYNLYIFLSQYSSASSVLCNPIQAFSDSLFPYFRDEQGNPRNERDREGLPLRSHLGRLTSDSTVRYFSHTPWLLADYVRSTVDGLVGPPVHKVRMVITPNVVVSGEPASHDWTVFINITSL